MIGIQSVQFTCTYSHHTECCVNLACCACGISNYKRDGMNECGVKYSTISFRPPLDIHWVWHVHMLAPTAYAEDCKRIVNRVIGHRLMSKARMDRQREATRQLWKKHFSQAQIPFDVTEGEALRGDQRPQQHKSDKTNTIAVNGSGGEAEKQEDGAKSSEGSAANGAAAPASDAAAGAEGGSKIRYKITAAAMRQAVFYYQVSLDHYRDPMFLTDAILRYKMYLYLKQRNKETFLVPCYDMDLIWHTHQVHPVPYQKDTTSVLGFVLKHDDSVNDRAAGSKLNNADDVTRRLWQDLFKVPFARPGSMFRGNPPKGKLFPLSQRYQKGLLAPKEMDVELSAVKMSSVPNMLGNKSDNHSGSAIFTVQLETAGTNGLTNKKKCIDLYSSECTLTNGNGGGAEKSAAGAGAGDDAATDVKIENPDGLVHFAVTHKNCPKLNVKLEQRSAKKSWFGNGRRASIASSEAPIDLFALMSNATRKEAAAATAATEGENGRSNSDETLSVSHRLAVNGGKDAAGNFILTELLMNLTNERLGLPVESRFKIQPGSFYECVIPEEVETLWGPIPLQRLPSGVSNKCRAVTHG